MFQFVGIAASTGITDVSDIMSEVLKEQARKLQDAQAEKLTSWEAQKLTNWQATD